MVTGVSKRLLRQAILFPPVWKQVGCSSVVQTSDANEKLEEWMQRGKVDVTDGKFGGAGGEAGAVAGLVGAFLIEEPTKLACEHAA